MHQIEQQAWLNMPQEKREQMTVLLSQYKALLSQALTDYQTKDE